MELQTVSIEAIVPQDDCYVITAEGKEFEVEQITKNPRYLILADDEPVSTCGANYTLVSHETVISKFEGILRSLGVTWVERKLRNPREWQMVGDYILERNVSPLRTIPDDRYDYGLTVTNSIDLSMGIFVLAAYTRIVCENGLYIVEIEARKKVPHLASRGDPRAVLDKLDRVIPRVVGQRQRNDERISRLLDVVATPDHVQRVLNAMNVRKYEFEKLADDGISGEFEDEGRKLVKVNLDKELNGYDLLNSVTRLANRVNTDSRQFELQTKALRYVERALGM